MSLEHLATLEAAIRPAELASDLGYPMSAYNGQIVMDCPSCSHQMWVLPTGFFCSDPLCHFRAGSVVDFMALHFRGMSRGLEELLSMYPSYLQRFAGMEIDSLTEEILQAARTKRALFDFFLELKLRRNDSRLDTLSAHAWLERHSIEPAATKSSIFPAVKADLQRFNQMVAAVTGETPNIPEQDCILFPFFANHHSLGTVMVFFRDNQKFYRVNCLPFKFSFFGLHETSPDAEIQLCYDQVAASRLNTYYANFHPGKASCALIQNFKGKFDPFVPDKVCYNYDGKEPLSSAAAFFLLCPHLRVKLHELNFETAEPTSWQTFITDEASRMLILQRNLTAEIRLFLSTAKLDVFEQAKILHALHKEGLFELVEEVEVFLKTAPIYEHGGLAIFKTSQGYVGRKKDETRLRITNFTLDLQRNLSFVDSADVFHLGVLNFEQSQIPAVLNAAHLDNAKDLESAARRVEAQSQGRHDSMPTVIDRTNTRHILNYLRQCVSNLPRLSGISRLGWALSRDVYFGPNWSVTAGALKTVKDVHFHPGVDILKSYSQSPFEETLSGIPLPGLVQMIAQAAAMLVRTYLQLSVKPIPIQNTQVARRVLSRVFAGLGQSEVVRLNFNTRGRELANIEGYPFFAYGYTDSQIDKSVLPAFILAETGALITNDVEDAKLDVAAAMLREAVMTTAQWVLKTNGQNFERRRSVSNAVELLQEGQDILSQVCGFDWPIIQSYQLIEQMLRQIPAESVPEVFAHYLAQQEVWIDTNAVTGIDLISLEIELRQLDPTVHYKDRFFVMNALAASEMLRTYYQGQAFARPVSTPSDPTKAVEGSVWSGI